MSIIFIDNIIFNDKSSERKFHLHSCFFFGILNAISLFCTSFFIFFYYKMPKYQNNPNSLSLYLIVIQGILCFLYFIIFIQIFFILPQNLTLFMKISGMFNPVIIFLSYFWISCLTHNIYVTYYNYKTNIDKRIKFYKYQSYFYIFIIYLLTNFNLEFTEEKITKKNFSFTNLYSNNFIILFSLINIVFIFYIISRLYYIFKKNIDFYSLSTEIRREIIIREIFTSLIKRHILCICYFIICFFPYIFCTILKETFDFDNFNDYHLNFITLTLISLYPTFIVVIKTTDPIMKKFIWKIIMCSKIGKVKKEKSSQKIIELCIFTESKTNLISTDVPEKENISSLISFQDKIKLNDSYEFNLDNGKNDIMKNENKNIINDKPFESNILTPINRINKLNDLELNLNINENENIISNNSINSISKNKIPIERTEMLIIEEKKKDETYKKNLIKQKTEIKEFHNKLRSIESINQIYSDDCKSFKSEDSKLTYINSSLINNSNNLEKNNSIISKTQNIFGLSPFDVMYYHLDLDDNLLRMMAISISIYLSRKYENNLKYKNYLNSTLPFNEQYFYKEKSNWLEFNEKNIPNWLSVKYDERFKKFNFKIKTYCPFVFYHIRMIDKISINNIIESLDPIKNLSYLNKLKVSGGRGDNSILSTWDKKFLLKTINKEEKKIFIKMLKLYHKRLRDTKTILCRIYGIYKIELKDKGKIHFILQKNMDSLPKETKILTFDLKGSTVDRQNISKIDEKLNRNILIEKYKNIVLKDIDLKILKFNFLLKSSHSKNLIKSIKNDSEFLERFEVIDYSLLVFVHKYRQNDICLSLNNYGIMKSEDKNYLFEFSIIDFLGPFNFEKKSEKLAKTFVGYIKQMKDTNFSVLDPKRYGLRFRNFAEKVIPINQENDSF